MVIKHVNKIILVILLRIDYSRGKAEGATLIIRHEMMIDWIRVLIL